MNKREAMQAMRRLARAGWRDGQLIRWSGDTGYSVSVVGHDGTRIRLDTLDSVSERLEEE